MIIKSRVGFTNYCIRGRLDGISCVFTHKVFNSKYFMNTDYYSRVNKK